MSHLKKRIFFLVLFGIGVLLFLNLLFKTGLPNIRNSLLQFSFTGFLVFCVVSILTFVLWTTRWNVVLKYHENLKIPFYKLFLHRLSAHALNYLTPTAQLGGEPLRAYFLQKEGVKSSHAISSIVIDKAIELSSFVIFIASGLVVGAIKGFFPKQFEELLIGIVIVFLLFVFWFYYATVSKIGFFSSFFKIFRIERIKRFDRLRGKLLGVEKHLTHFHRGHLHKFAWISFISLLTLGMMMLEHFTVAYFLGVKLTLTQVFLVTTIPAISYIIPIPGALGVLESTHAMMFGLLGVNINVFVFVLVFRIRDILFIILGLLHGSREGYKMAFKSH